MDNQVHLSQSVPMFSPLTWKLTGDVGKIGLALHHKHFQIFFREQPNRSESECC